MNEFKMSLFLPPISPVKDSTTGQTIQSATLTPHKEVTLQEVYQLVTHSERLKLLTGNVRRAVENGDEKLYRTLKQQTLPYVTPCGVFSYRNCVHLVNPSGLTVVDIDHLDSPEEAEMLKRQLFSDHFLCPALAFISPSGRGVKAFIPYDLTRDPDVKRNAAENIYWAMNYVHSVYDSHNGGPDKEDDKKKHPDKGVDISGKDLVRACFLSYDEKALIRL